VLAFLDFAENMPPGEFPRPRPWKKQQASPEEATRSGTDREEHASPPPEPTLDARPIGTTAPVDKLMERVRRLCDVEAIEPDQSEQAWRAILEEDILWGLDVRTFFERELFDYLADRRIELDDSVWILLEEEFLWREQSLSLYRRLPARGDVDHVLSGIHRAFAGRGLAPRAMADRPVKHAFTWMESLSDPEAGEKPSQFDRVYDFFEGLRFFERLPRPLIFLFVLMMVRAATYVNDRPRTTSSQSSTTNPAVQRSLMVGKYAPLRQIVAVAERYRPDLVRTNGFRFGSRTISTGSSKWMPPSPRDTGGRSSSRRIPGP
jgi:hypothetical protein